MVVAEHELSILDFKTTSSTCIRFPSDSSTDSRTSFIDIEWISYCPDVFRILQEYGKIDEDDYMNSICGQETMRHIGFHGKNGSLIYLPHDDRFVIRTIHKCELKGFLEKLPNYYHHVRKYRSTLLTKIYGLHVVKPSGGQKATQPICKVHFVVLGNVLHSDLPIHKRFDLRGFSQGQGFSRAGAEETSTNEENLDIVFHLDKLLRNNFIAQIKHDCKFLEGIGVTGYSLLLGIHLPSPKLGDTFSLSSNDLSTHSAPTGSDDRMSFSSQDGCSQVDSGLDLTTDVLQSPGQAEKTATKLGVRMMARAVRKNRNFSLHRSAGKGRPNNIILFLEITDILHGYGMVKRANVFKSHSFLGGNSKAYAARFQDFISQIFPENDS